MKTVERIFGVERPFIAMCHLGALPGRPRHDVAAGIEGVVRAMLVDLEHLQDGGVDGLLFCNENDIPYQLEVGPEIIAAVSAVIGRLHSHVRLPFGVDVAWDAKASIAVAKATGASFVRGTCSGVYATEMGLMSRGLGDLTGYRTAIGAGDVALFNSITPEFGRCVAGRSVEERARDSVFFGAEALLISGKQAGDPVPLGDLEAASAVAGDVPVLANTGVNHETSRRSCRSPTASSSERA